MSRAFVKEADGDDFAEDLPERPVSDQPNFVTPRGLRLIDAELERLRKDLAAAKTVGERAIIARASRDLRYWTRRRASAQQVGWPSDPGRMVFGASVTVEREDARRQTFRIVGEDEADPAAGRISWFSPMARAVSGGRVGDLVTVAQNEVEIVAIDIAPDA
ncbi:MAG: transcription elongation factor GreA [Hyphomicrobiales bacterium]